MIAWRAGGRVDDCVVASAGRAAGVSRSAGAGRPSSAASSSAQESAWLRWSICSVLNSRVGATNTFTAPSKRVIKLIK
eukprot:1188944-Prorocentrum_minimum.AAC.1